MIRAGHAPGVPDYTGIEHGLLLIWLTFAGLALFSLYAAWNEGVLALFFAGDRSRISWAISGLFLAVSCHAARRAWYLSSQLNAATRIRQILERDRPACLRAGGGRVLLAGDMELPDSILTGYLHDLAAAPAAPAAPGHSGDPPSRDQLMEVYVHRLRNPHELGWFASDIMIKLGLLGTIVGFVLMLGSVLNVTDFDPATMQAVLKDMSSGMGTALYTTFAGLVCSILTSAQYYLLDQGAGHLIETARHVSRTRVVPQIPAEEDAGA